MPIIPVIKKKKKTDLKYMQSNLKSYTFRAVLNSLILGPSQSKCEIMLRSIIETKDSCQYTKSFVMPHILFHLFGCAMRKKS